MSFGRFDRKKDQKKQKLPEVPYVQLEVSTWSKDSHSLYDYEAVENKFQTENYNLKEDVKIYRHVTTLKTVLQDSLDQKQLAMENIYISSLVFKEQSKHFCIQSADVSGVQPHPMLRKEHPDLFKNSYLALRDYQHEPGVEGYPLSPICFYPLEPGNIVRLGRVEYLVIEIRDNEGVKTFRETSHMEINKEVYRVPSDLKIEGSCKICLCEEGTAEDPLISPCECKGSCALIHVGCLKNWIFSKIRKETEGVATTYNFSKFECEICKASFPKAIELATSQRVEMITLEKPQRPYLFLESVSEKDSDKKQRNLHLITPEQNSSIKLGRGHQCEVRITDISVSRTHSEIRYEKGQFFVRDLKSKFGTLIKFREELQLRDSLKIQYGRTCLEFRLVTQSQEESDESSEEVPVFYTRAQLREMGQLSDQEDEEY